ncbi:SGNH/GDSL hydrolase family protein [Coraliomargarita algicola]|uniref:SGNH/GDSL hydrolase family protein n=1 Tax=Coraliomargarita algicola TaxID=3092156 RepID=A0ABZ0RIN8_9BACT|nr:SGNH/GDSL hydrolase family protein [Coraliomargarita sp. J2-16]WPJ95109.1 SGNH/GDSL hydrolase family protein [Coraliomargarita sp. J2-16]
MPFSINNFPIYSCNWVSLFFAWIGCVCTVVASQEPGSDVVAAFSRATKGEPLRYVAIGGSITQASSSGWIGDWLDEQFPKSEISVVNSGMSGTGSSLGIFRIDRDIISHAPDLVVIEYCVNDGGLTDEQAILYMETLVVRLKSLPHPPAIVIVEAAARRGVNLQRHRRIARHYGLVEADMQAAVEAHLSEHGEDWNVLFSDDVHPNRAGHALYAETLRNTLRPLLNRARSKDRATATPLVPLPPPLSTKPLLLDARLVPLQAYITPDWKTGAPPSAWWGRFFQGAITAEAPGTALRLPVRGTTFGLFYARDTDNGSFLVNVDDSVPSHVYANTRDGFSYLLAGVDLPAREHMLNVVLPAESEIDPSRNGSVTLGYLLLAGETQATREPSPQGTFTPEVLRDLNLVPVPADAWSWTGPFSLSYPKEQMPIDARADTFTKFAPEPGDANFSLDRFTWKPVSAESNLVDFRTLIGEKKPSFVYARTEFDGGSGGQALLSITVDYYCQLWLNGERIIIFDGPHPRPHFSGPTESRSKRVLH